MCGDINVDIMMSEMTSLPVVDREVYCRNYEVTIGSSGAICACNYASLGGTVYFLGLCGEDEHGRFMLEGMNDFGINTDLVRTTRTVGTGVTVNLTYENTRTQVTYPGTIAEFEGSDIDGSILGQFHHVHFAGPYPQTKFRPEILRLLKLALSLGVSTSLDPQWDPAETWEFMDEWLPNLTYFFCNSDEAVSITGSNSIEEACRLLAAKTPCPIVKTGEEGALCLIDNSVQRFPVYRTEIVDTTGAGDAFDSGFLFVVLEKEYGMPEAIRFANAAAARSCQFIGGVNNRSSFEDVLAFARA
jgi:sugar/nucleoside kinase (ribokinase family)